MSKDPKDPLDDENEEGEFEDGFDPEEYFNDIDEDDLAEAEEEIKKEHERLREMPLYKSAVNIRKLTTSLAETIKEEEDSLMMKDQMLMNAYILDQKLRELKPGICTP